LPPKSGHGRDRNRQKEEDDVRLDVGDSDVVGLDREKALEIFDRVGRHRLSLRHVGAPACARSNRRSSPAGEICRAGFPSVSAP
jgi:hypothetical protein